MKTERQKNLLYFLLIGGVAIFAFAFIKGGSIERLGLIEGLLSENYTFDNISANIRWALMITLVYAACATAYYTGIGNNRPDAYGSEKWGDVKELSERYRDKNDPYYNKIFSENMYLSYDNRATEQNANALILGSSGRGKTAGYAIPNLMNCSCSYIDVDPKGEHLEMTGNRMIKMGYKVRVLNLVDFEHSDCYNPFKYIDPENYQRDMENLVDIIFAAADTQGGGGKDKSGNTVFFDTSAKSVALAIMYYVYFEYPENKRHFGSVMEIKRDACQVSGSMTSATAPTLADPLFDALEKRDPNHIALRYWREYSANQANVKKDIASTLNAKFSKFNNDKLVDLTRFDDMDLPTVGEEKTIIYLVVSDTDKSLNFIVSIFYAQLFDQLFKTADTKYGNKGYPIHVELLMDEFANIKLPDDFEQKLSTMRSRNISASIILQTVAQIEGLFEKQWETIVDNCASLLFLGSGSGTKTAEYVSKIMGKYTLDISNYSESKGMRGSDSESKQQKDRELMTPNELRRMSKRKCIYILSGEFPILDNKAKAWLLPTIQYSGYDKKEGKSYKKEASNMFESYDTSVAKTVDTGDLSDMPCYFFVSGTEISEGLMKIKSQREMAEKQRLREEKEEMADNSFRSRRGKRAASYK